MPIPNRSSDSIGRADGTIATRSASTPKALLSSKLNPPTFRASQVPRRHLNAQVVDSPTGKLVLVRAPAGFGKTTTMAQIAAHLQANEVATAWLTLDDADNDVSRFLWCLQSAVSRLLQDDLPADTAEEQRNGTAGDVALDIVARLARERGAFTLFLDDFEWIREQAVLGLVRQIIEHLPRRGQLVIGSRTLPNLTLGRLRAHGHLLEIDAAQLRFTPEETADFLLCKRGLALAQHELERIQDRTEGWVTALWLASLALEGHDAPSEFIERFSGADRAIAEYLAEEVLARQNAQTRDFLLQTSVLRHLNVPLCQALVPGVDCEAMLERLDAANVFLTPIEGEQRSYRYHSLFADFLRATLEREKPGAARDLHRAASEWYETQDRPVPAIDHALEGGDHARAVTLLNEHADSLLAMGRMRLLARWFDALPAQMLRDNPHLQVVHIWAVCFTRGPHETLALLEITGLMETRDPAIRAHIQSIEPLVLAMMDRHDQAYIRGQTGLERLPSDSPFADMALINAMANVYSVLGRHDEAHALLDKGRDIEGGHSSEFNVMYSESVEGIIDLLEGRQRQAAARFRLAVNASRRGLSFSHSSGNAWAGVLHASTLYEADQLAETARLLHVYVPLARDVGLADHMILGDTMLSRIAFHNGDADGAFQILTGLEHIGRIRQLDRVVAGARLERSRLLLLQGHSRAALQELERAKDPDLWCWIARMRLTANDLEYLQLARLRWEINAGDADWASADLAAAHDEARLASRHRRALKLALLRAMALYRAGAPAEAFEQLTAVLQEACGEGFLRLIIDEGPLAGRLLRDFNADLKGRQSSSDDPILREYRERLLEAFGHLPAETPETDDPRQELIEPLTRKEIHVLQLLAEGYSNSAMAEKLFVSDSTVRTHLRNINAKLGARSRTQAVAIARRLGLIG